MLVVLPAARLDLLGQTEYYDSQGGDELGDRFVRQCEAAFERLLRFPKSGAPVPCRSPRLVHCRFIPVPDFDSILIFYRLTVDQVQIVRFMERATSKRPWAMAATGLRRFALATALVLPLNAACRCGGSGRVQRARLRASSPFPGLPVPDLHRRRCPVFSGCLRASSGRG